MVDKVQSLVARSRLVGIIRLDDLQDEVEIARALLDAGVKVLEFTLSNPAALEAIVAVRAAMDVFNSDEAAIGLGSVRSIDEVDRAIAAGAQFIVTPITRPAVIEHCVAAGVPIMAGAYTPTEIATAWDAGASFVKIFPARNLGPSYVKDVLAPMPFLRLMPTGGIDLNNMQAYFDAGAVAVGVGGNIIDARAVAARDWRQVTAVAAQYVERAQPKL